ncbi:MAG TPA: anti-sigma factor [Methylophilaceae bacterium]|jgi:anti-sigma-K factor RskA
MRYDNPNLREMLAAEYVLGTLHGAARRRYEALRNTRRDWQQSTDWWASRINLLGLTVTSVNPAAKVWRGIENRLFANGKSGFNWWRALALGSSSLAIALAIFIASNLLKAPAPPVFINSPATVALLANDEAKPGWILSLGKTRSGKTEMRVTALASIAKAPGKSFELWVLPADKSKPISLGLLPKQGNGTVHVADKVAPMLANGGLAVSLEPEGGSPTGQPTGAVLYQGKLTQI